MSQWQLSTSCEKAGFCSWLCLEPSYHCAKGQVRAPHGWYSQRATGALFLYLHQQAGAGQQHRPV
jgi:hypothetical protein